MALTNDLSGFCCYLAHKHGDPGGLTEECKADEFRRIYQMEPPVSIKHVMAAAACCQIKLRALENMPPNLRGYHEVYNGSSTIYYKDGDSVSGLENTVLHEIREMMEPYLAEAFPCYQPLTGQLLHNAANRFASAVLLPQEDFTKRLYQTGLDVFKLAGYYAKSLSQTLLRMGEVLNGKLFFYGALCQPEEEVWSVYYRTLCPNLFPDPDYTQLGAFFPTKGAKITSGSLVDMAIKEGNPYIAHIVTLIDGLSEEGRQEKGLVALAQPQLDPGRPSVTLVVLMRRDKDFFLPQIERSKPIILEGFQRASIV